LKITVIGTGYVGLVSGTCLAEVGNDVLCLDLDAEKIRILNSGGIPIHEPGLLEMVARNRAAGRLRFTTDVAEAVAHGLLQIIAVGTPPDEDGSADLQYVLAAARNIGRLMTHYKVVIDKSIVPVGTGAAPSSPNTPPTPCVAAHPPGPAEAARSARLPHARAVALSKDSGLMQQAKTISARPTVCYVALCL
jgi:nucleotide sugar dehydrogenase